MSPKNQPVTHLPAAPITSLKHLSKEEFARNLYEMMASKGWTQSELSRRAGIGRDNVSQYIRGRTYPTPNFLAKLAQALGTTPEELLPNYYEDAVERAAPQTEYREIPGDDVYCWIRMNKRVLKKNATKIIDLSNQTE